MEKVTDLKFEVRRYSKMRTSAAFALASHGQKHSWKLFQQLNTK